MRILYISDSYLSMSVFMSQVHTICNYHSESNEVRLVCLCSHNDFKLQKPIDSKYELIKLYRYPKMFIPFVNYLRALTATIFLKRYLYWADVVHCRGHVGSAFAINLMRQLNIFKPLIADIRGAIVEELNSKKSVISQFYCCQARSIEKMVFRKATVLFFVSKNMEKYYQEKYNFRQYSFVFPTIVDERLFYKSDEIRKKYRKLLNIGDRQAYIYVGGVDYWQNIDKIIMKFNILNIENPNKYFFILLTNNPLWVKKFCKANNIETKNFYIYSVPYSEVAKYINASDFGVIIRDKNIINHVASPTKINEYLSCGLKIIDDLNSIGYANDNIFIKNVYMPIKDVAAKQNKIYKNMIKEIQ